MSLRRSCALLGVVDADTLKVEWGGEPRLLRLADVDPDSAAAGGNKPATDFGRRNVEWARNEIFAGSPDIEIEFAGTSVELSNSGKLLAYVHVGGDNYNVRLIREGWSPCYEKYGRPRIHRAAMEQAELWARYEGCGIWGGLGGRGDRTYYCALRNHWRIRAGLIDDFRHATAMGEDILTTRLDYSDIVARARAGSTTQLFAELTRQFCLPDGGVAIQLGSPQQPLHAMFPRGAMALARFLEREFIGFGKPNYLYFNGRMSNDDDHPQIMIERLEQVRMHPTMHVTHI